MSLSTRKYLSQIVLGTGAVISELEDATPDPHIEYLVGMAAGYPEPVFIGAHKIKPDIVFSSMQLKSLLDACNTGGAAPYGADQSTANTDLFYQDSANKGSRTAVASLAHQRFRLAKAMLYWTQISASDGQEARISARLKPVWDGTNIPLVATGSLAITGSPVGSERYTLGSVKVNGTLLDGIVQVQIDSGIVLDEAGSEGELYDSFCGIERTAPSILLTGNTIEWWNTYGLLTALTNVTVYLRQKSSTGNWPDVNVPSKHISLIGTAGGAAPDRTNGIKSQTTLRVTLAAPSFVAPSLTINTATDIT